MEIKKKGNKWVAVDQFGIEYTHKHIDTYRYAKPVSKIGGMINYLWADKHDVGRFLLYIETFENYYKPIEPPKPFWHKYKVDTPVLVRSSNDTGWKKRYFCKEEFGLPSTYSNGATSWSAGTSPRGRWSQIKDVETGEVWKAN